MADNSYLNDLPANSKSFFSRLAKNNNKKWFDKHKPEYQDKILEPAKFFVEVMGNKLRKIDANIVAIPKVNKSIFRIYRDVRFSKNKTPYKSHLGILFWNNSGLKLESPGFYCFMGADKIYVACGHYIFPKNTLKSYRESLENPELNLRLEKAIKSVKKNGYEISGKHYKRIPSGFNAEIKNAELLLYNGLHPYKEIPYSSISPGEDIIDLVYGKFSEMKPIYNWLLNLL